MGKTNLVSIIIPVYNVAPFLSEALDSVIQQTYHNLEIIIIDDGSVDGSQEICEEYAKKDKRIILIHQDNNGLSAARNVGLNIMTGELVAFLDSDDKYHPNYIQSMINVMERNAADLVICKYIINNTRGEMNLREKEQCIFPQIAPGTYDRANALHVIIDKEDHAVWDKLYKTSLWNGIRFPDGYVYEDYYTTCQIVDRCQRVFVINDILYYHRKRSGSITDTTNKKYQYDYILARLQLESFIALNTPTIFSHEKLGKIRQSNLNQMIDYYACIPTENGETNLFFSNQLKKRIIEYYGRIEKHLLTTRICICLIRFCPSLFRNCYSVYNRCISYKRKVTLYRSSLGVIKSRLKTPFYR